jgi:hypothetical protein
MRIMLYQALAAAGMSSAAGAVRASGHFETKREAISQGREVSRSQGTELRIHNRDGRIAQSDSHGRDPNPPRG